MRSTIKINGMHCNSCEVLLTDVLGDIPGVTNATVIRETEIAIVDHDASVNEATLRKAIESEGYTTEATK